MLSAPTLLVALAVEAAMGYPAILFRRIRHPVVWIGALIAALDRRLNPPGRPAGRVAGALALLLVLLAVGLAAGGIALLLRTLPYGWIAEAVLASSLLAQRSLHDHVAAVARGLDAGLEEGRRAVAQIVGRDPASLDRPAVARAAVESLAENFSDGVVAPAFWALVGGLPGIALYKAINTADSMIGHRTPRHLRFGWAAARLDDVVNLPASRLAALLIALARPARLPAILRALARDAGRHRSPNAGWPEAAMATALGLRLAGPRTYGGVTVEDGWMGDGTPDAGPDDIRRALAVFRAACLILFAAAALLCLPG